VLDHDFAIAMMTEDNVANDAVRSADRSGDFGVAIDFAVVDHGRDDVAGATDQSSKSLESLKST